MRSFFALVAIVACAIIWGFSILPASNEPGAPESPSQASPSTTAQAEQKTEVLSTSPGSAFRIEQTGVGFSGGQGESTGDVWVIATKDPTQRAKLPKQSSESPLDDEFHFSPNEEWIFGLRHVGSGLRYGNVYHLARPLKIDKPINGEFNDVVWENCVKLGALKEDYSAEGVYAMTFFVAWSFDSSRLLIKLYGGEEKRSMKPGLLYFNTRTKKFEVTDYLRKVNKKKPDVLACAEPVDPLPSEAELKTRFDSLDRQLNDKYAEVLAHTEKDRIPVVRETSAIGSSIAMKARNCTCRAFPPRRKNDDAFSFLAMSLPRGSIHPRRSGRLNDDRAQKQAIICLPEIFRRSK